jgi:hypothetical protein
MFLLDGNVRLVGLDDLFDTRVDVSVDVHI